MVNLAETLDGQKKVVIKCVDVENVKTESEKEYCEREPKLLRDL